QANLTACADTPVLARDGSEETCVGQWTDANGCPVTGNGTWSNYPANSIPTTHLTVCSGEIPTDAQLLAQANWTACADTPVLARDDSAKTYTIRCTDANGCPVTGNGTWSNYPANRIPATPLTVCSGEIPTDAQLLAQANLTACADTPVLARD